jgi:hypothetical protein
MNNILSCLLIVLLVGCTNSTKKNSPLKSEVELAITDHKIEVAIDSVSFNRADYLMLIKNKGENVLCWLNRKKNSIQFYNLANSELLQEIIAEKEGPQGIGTIQGFYVHSLDSVYVSSRQYSRVVLLNSQGEIRQVIDYRYSSDGTHIYPARIGSNPLKRIEFWNNKMYLPGIAVGNWNTMTMEQLLSSRLCIEVDTLSKRVEFLPFTYPSDYWEEGKKEPIFSRIMEGGKFIYSFWGDHNIYVTDDHIGIARYPAGSRYFDKVNPYPKDMDMETYLRYICQTGKYGSIVYDAYRRVYYRFAFLPDSIQLGDDLNKKVQNPTNPTIIILNADFRVIGETQLPPGRFYLANFFITEDGLYLSENHPDNPHMSDDRISFTRLSLVH